MYSVLGYALLGIGTIMPALRYDLVGSDLEKSLAKSR